MRLIDADALRDRFQNLAYNDWNQGVITSWADAYNECADIVDDMPSVEPTLYGYKIEHLAYIARVMQKEGITAEDAARTFDDLGRAVSWTIDEVRQKMKEVIYDHNTCKI